MTAFKDGLLYLGALLRVCLGNGGPYGTYQLFLEPVSGDHREVMTAGVRTGGRLIS